ncbi:MAG TPA: ATP synthase F1 subunit delta [Dehalococcoidia bacterium]|nr:ATP synthase F1 subunit delta [Dehalococcoidia bacterium]
MIRQIAAKRYAEGVLELARSQDKLEEWSELLQLISRILGDPQVASLMASARISTTNKISLAERLFEGLDPLALNLVRLLVSKGRGALAPEIAEAYQEMVDEERGIAHATVTTAVPLSAEEEQMVARRLAEISGKQVVLQTRVDENIIGGLVARVGDRLIDGSTKSRLQSLKRKLEGAEF